MQRIEFFTPAPGCFAGSTFYKDDENGDYKSLDQITENMENILFQKFLDNAQIKKYIAYLKKTGINTISELVSRCIVKFFSKLDNVWDIDGDTLNLETN